MQSRFYVSREGQNSGPWTIEEIAQRLSRADLAATDFIYDEAAAAWIPILESKPLVDVIKSRAPSAPPPAQGAAAERVRAPAAALSAEPASSDSESLWLVRRGPGVYGPFTYFGLIRALQEKSVFEFDHVRLHNETSWARIAEREEFTAERMRELLMRQEKDAFLTRRFARKPIEQDAIVHDNKKTWIGRTYEGSEGGAGIVVRNALLVPGQVVHVHFGKAEGLAPFNALCEVVSKKFVPDVRDARTPVPYGLKFLQIDPRAVQAAREYFSQPQPSLKTPDKNPDKNR